jgi:hypothetical protein
LERFKAFKAVWSADMEAVEFNSLSCARPKRACRPVPGAKRWSSLRRTNSSSVGGVRLLAAHLYLSVCCAVSSQLCPGVPVFEALPTQAHGCVHADKQEEWSPQ